MLAPSHLLLLALLILLALVVFGPKRLPELGASVGRAIQEFKRASSAAATELRSVTDVHPTGDEVGTRTGPAPETPDPGGWSGDTPHP
ncbi:MAG TPA: twin-arginine translocase TatA/TatE family subunit [Verrucomicrobiae bacterium]|nr:twin-arginine translocase TatA/TatE family subunit [Verrucomicrobiae bacterium]